MPELSGSILDYFEEETGKKFNKFLDEVVEKGEILELERFELKFKSGEKINAKIIFNFYENGNALLIFCTIIPRRFDVSVAESSRISYKIQSEQSIIKDTTVYDIVERVKSLFPFTYIGREIIHKSVDNLEEIFWISDSNGKLLVVNEFLAKSMGFNSLQMEGKNANDFLPGYLKNLNLVIGDFIKDTINCSITEGIYFKEIKELRDRQVVQIPLFDQEENICALIGFSQECDPSVGKNMNQDKFEDYFKILDYFPKPVAFITDNGIFKHSSEDFSKLLHLNPDELHGLKFADILPESLTDSIQRFVLSSDKLRILPLSRNLEIAKTGEPEYTIYITKLFNDENDAKGISILLEKIEYVENLQQLIKGRGRMFEFLIQNNPEPIFVYDKENLQFLEANQAALDFYGYARDEFLQMDLTDLYNSEDIQSLLGSSEDKESEGKFSTPIRHKRKDGSLVYVELSKISFKFNNRDAFFNSVKDISQRLELDKKNQLFKAVLNDSVNMIFITDSDGIISFVNRAVIDKLGLQRDELKGSSMASLADEEDRLTINSTIFQTHLTDPVELNVGLKSAGGKILNTEICATPILDFENNIESFIISGKSVESVVGETTKPEEVSGKKEDEETSIESSQIETAFLSGVFHEILTPMNVILGFAQELTEGIENLSPDQKEAVEIINQNRGKLLSTMNAIIEFFDIQKKRDEWDITEFTITNVVEELSRDLFEITGSKEVELSYGKISSSLGFETDKQKFDCLINSLIRLMCRLIGDAKIYFSAYQVDDKKFMIMISDNYSSVSDGLTETLNKLFIDKKDPKELGIPKLGVQITQSLIKLLGVKYSSSVDDSGNHEVGFLFPIKFDPFDRQPEESIDEKVADRIGTGELDWQSKAGVEEFDTDQVSEYTEEDFTSDATGSVDEVFDETPISADDIEEYDSRSDEEPETKQEQPDILSSSENKFDAIDFVSHVDSTPHPSETEESSLTEEPTDVTDNLNKPLDSESETDLGESIPESDFQPLSSQLEEETPPENGEVPELFDVPEPPPDESLEDISLINRQGFTIEDSTESPIPQSEDKLELSGLTCLYIEDQVDSQILFKVQMKGLKDIKYAVSFEDALPLLDTESFDFIVMDINLQGEYNGLDALKIIHKMPKYEEVPIIAVTAYVLPGDKQKFIATGFNDFISKPIFREKMISSLEKIFLQKA